MRGNKPETSSIVSKQIIVSLLVIALTTVIFAQASSISAGEQLPVATVAAAAASAIDHTKAAQESVTGMKSEAPASSEQHQQPQQQVEPKNADTSEVAKDAASAGRELSASKIAAAVETGEQSADANKRKGRAEAESPAATKEGESKTVEKQAPAAEKSAEKSTKSESKTATPKASKPASSSSTKSGTKSKLPANLGTVTSTGSGGPAHYMSKHDAYSAIAEKHGASMVTESMKKPDRRSQLQGFGGIQKASGGLGDVLSPFKGLTDSGLARSLGASMRSIMKSKYSVPAYVASALLGAVALLAFYESPISPLPVPPLPEPPVGRFPPEMPNISPNAQVPFRTNQQYNNQQAYSNQRSFNGLTGGYQPQAQQVLFPGSNNAQQRQMNVGPQQQQSQQAAGPVQQLAANLVNLAASGKQQVAQRKSSPDYDQSSSRSFFGSSAASNISPKVSGPANQQQKSNSFLSFFGLGAANSPPSAASSNSPTSQSGTSAANGDIQSASGANLSPSSQTGASGSASAGGSSNLLEPKGQTSNGLSNSHLVNKVKSYFSRAPVSSASGSSTAAGIAGASSNPYDQYSRMSFVQALLKDTAFLPAFLAPNRKSSTSPTSSVSSSSSSSASNKISSLTSAISSATNPNPSARMQVDSHYGSGIGSQLGPLVSAASNKQKPAAGGSSYGLARAADRIAHAFLETFTSGVMQRNASPSQDSADSNKKQSSAGSDEYMGHPSLASATTSLITDLVSNYGSSFANGMESVNQQQQQQLYDQQQAGKSSAASQHQQAQLQSNNKQQQQQQHGGNSQQQQSEAQVASGRSSSDSTEEQQQVSAANNGKQQQVAAVVSQSQSPASSANDNSQAHVRKTRSIGLEYPIESNQNLAIREQQPSKASQINNVIDFVADSYTNNRLLFNFVMNQVGLSQAVPYVEQILASGANDQHHH